MNPLIQINPLLNLILLICSNNQISRTSLNKLIYFCDIISFIVLNKKLTNSRYKKLQYGPVPEDIDLYRLQLEFENKLIENEVLQYGYRQFNYKTNLDNVDIKLIQNEFNEDQLKIIRDVVSIFGGASASMLSEITHAFEPWKSAEYYSILNLEESKSDKSFLQFLSDLKFKITPTS